MTPSFQKSGPPGNPGRFNLLADHRRFRILNIVDEHSRFCPGPIVDVSISGARLARNLDELAEHHGLPQEIVLDNRAPAGRAIRP
jgi:transposase InsO family protein